MSIEYTPDNTFIFSFVRMNPPTPGHLVLVKNLIDKAIELGSEKAYIITSSSMDGKNPMPCSLDTIPKPKNKADGAIMESIINNENLIYKSQILEEMIAAYKRELIEEENKRLEELRKDNSSSSSSSSSSASSEKAPEDCVGDSCAAVGKDRRSQIANLHVIVLCSTGSPFVFINSIIRKDFIERGVSKINIFFIVGRDRADFLDTIVDTFQKYDYVSSIDGLILKRDGMTALKSSGLEDRSIADIDLSEYSASFVRNLVRDGSGGEFRQVYEKYLLPEDIDKMFETINIGITMKPPASKDEDENPASRYFDSGLLPIIVPPKGGRKRKTRRYKKSKKQSKKNKRRTKKRKY
jgi:hypothetical protein